MPENTYTSKLPGGEALSFSLGQGIFKPTYTSELFVQALAKLPKKTGAAADLGCGCGIVGIMAAKMGLVAGTLCASDLSSAAVESAKANARTHGVAIEARVGSLFEPWKGRRFDLVIDDISGITEAVAKLSPWYADNIPCATGPDGTELTVRAIQEAPGHLNPGGVFLFPVISLSNAGKILEAAKKCFGAVEKMTEQQWMLPPEMAAHRPELKRLKEEGRIHFDEKFGMMLCSTQVHRCVL